MDYLSRKLLQSYRSASHLPEPGSVRTVTTLLPAHGWSRPSAHRSISGGEPSDVELFIETGAGVIRRPGVPNDGTRAACIYLIAPTSYTSRRRHFSGEQAVTFKKTRKKSAPKVRILVIDENFRAIPNLGCLLHDDGFVLGLKSHMHFTVVTDEMFDDYQAVIVDVMIPCSGGFDLVRDIRKNTCVPVLVLTALGDEENRVIGLEFGADDYVTKPCRPREVVARMHALLRRQPR